MRGVPIECAAAVVAERFAGCHAAVLAGSAARGEATPHSDLDLVVVGVEGAPYRESFRHAGWPVEAFVHDEASCRDYFLRDAARRRPSLPTMFVEGVVVRDHDGAASRLRAEARAILEKGPAAPSADDLAWARYRVTDLIDDLRDARDRHEAFIVAGELTVAAVDLVLDALGQWRGRGKWVLHALTCGGPTWERRLRAALDALAERGDVRDLVAFADAALELVGGRLFEGFSTRPLRPLAPPRPGE